MQQTRITTLDLNLFKLNDIFLLQNLAYSAQEEVPILINQNSFRPPR